VVVPPPARLKPRKRPLPQTDREVRGNTAGLIRTVETARVGSRSNALYWAACRVAENSDIDRTVTARQIEEAAIRAGLSAKEAAGTVRSGLRRGGRYGL